VAVGFAIEVLGDGDPAHTQTPVTRRRANHVFTGSTATATNEPVRGLPGQGQNLVRLQSKRLKLFGRWFSACGILATVEVSGDRQAGLSSRVGLHAGSGNHCAKGTAGQSAGVHRKTPRKTRRYGMDNGLRRALKTQPLSTRRYPLEPPFSGSSPVAPTTHDHHPPFVPDLLQSAAQSAQVVLTGTFPVLSPVLEALLCLHPSKSRYIIASALKVLLSLAFKIDGDWRDPCGGRAKAPRASPGKPGIRPE
jgi:hypothetical protein